MAWTTSDEGQRQCCLDNVRIWSSGPMKEVRWPRQKSPRWSAGRRACRSHGTRAPSWRCPSVTKRPTWRSPPSLEGEGKRKETRKLESERIRAKSRKIILDYLAENCQGTYKLEGWDNIYFKLDNYNKQKEVIEKSGSSTKGQELKKEWNEVSQEIKVGLEANVPGLPVGIKAMMEYNTHKSR